MTSAIVMAAGKGTRMKSNCAKVMHKVLDKPMLEHIYDTLQEVGTDKIVVIVGSNGDEIKAYFKDKLLYAEQNPQLGSGHAVMQGDILRSEAGKTLIVNGDCPLITAQTYQKMLEKADDYPLVLLTCQLDDPKSYGRIIRDDHGEVSKIVEFKDCDAQEVLVKEINAGIYCVDNELLWKYLPEITNDNAQKEYYVTDLVEIFINHGHKVGAVIGEDVGELSGVNTREELAGATKWLQHQINNYWLDHGITLINPDTTYISKQAIIGIDTIIGSNVSIEGSCVIGSNNTITEGSYLNNAQIGDNNVITSSRVTDSVVGNNITLGPWAHLRNGCQIGDNCRIGNFVEMKNAKFGDNSKCAHLTYLGDCVIGKNVNVGCGVVTVNYDGKHKYQTIVGDGAFIGSNVNMIAPVVIGDNTVLAAGSTITQDVSSGDMAIARTRQEIKPGYGLIYKNK